MGDERPSAGHRPGADGKQVSSLASAFDCSQQSPLSATACHWAFRVANCVAQTSDVLNRGEMGGTRKVQVHVTFKDTAKAEDGLVRTIEISQDGSNSVKDVKMKIAVRMLSRVAHLCVNPHLTTDSCD